MREPDVKDEIVIHYGTTMVCRLRLAPGEAMPWHRDPFRRIAVVLRGDVLSSEYRDGGESQRIEITPGEVEWEEPTERVHRAVNVGEQSYEQVTIFLLDLRTQSRNPATSNVRNRHRFLGYQFRQRLPLVAFAQDHPCELCRNAGRLRIPPH
jgi:quercetin dioxygenase-like cupin family protein